MIYTRYLHKSVVMKNKLFVVGGSGETASCEVLDSTCNKFVLLKPPPESFKGHFYSPAEVISIRGKLVVFGNDKNAILFYDAENDEWIKEHSELTSHLVGFCCAKVPQL